MQKKKLLMTFGTTLVHETPSALALSVVTYVTDQGWEHLRKQTPDGSSYIGAGIVV